MRLGRLGRLECVVEARETENVDEARGRLRAQTRLGRLDCVAKVKKTGLHRRGEED